MQFPIWVSATELECCQPDATVGEPWVASVVCLKPAEPWWVKHTSNPVSDEVLSLGAVSLEGAVASTTLRARSAIVDVGGMRVLVPGDAIGPTLEGPLSGRLWLDAHEHPDYMGVDGLEWKGIVRRIRGIRLIYQPVTVYLAIPVEQAAPVELRSTSDRNDPAVADRGFAEFLIDLEM